MRFTTTLSAKVGACKHTPCVLLDWQLHEVDKQRLEDCDASEVTLRYIPSALLVEITDEQSNKSIQYVVRPEHRRWNRATEAARRRAAETHTHTHRHTHTHTHTRTHTRTCMTPHVPPLRRLA